MSRKPTLTPPPYRPTKRSVYDGGEMGRTCLRPGAYDAYDMPSLMGSQRIYRKDAVRKDAVRKPAKASQATTPKE